MRIPGIAGGIDVISRRWAEAGNLNNNGFVPGFGKMSLAWWFCVIASRRKRLEFRLVEAISVSDAPRSGNHSCDAIVAMGMGCDPGMRGHAKHNGVYPSLIRIAFQDHRLDACNSRCFRYLDCLSQGTHTLPASSALQAMRREIRGSKLLSRQAAPPSSNALIPQRLPHERWLPHCA